MKPLITYLFLASSITILAMENNNNNRTIQADESTHLLIRKVKYDQDIEECVMDCCCMGFMKQKYQQIKEERELDFQLKMAEKKRQLATLLSGVNNTVSPITATPHVMGQFPTALPDNHEEPCANCTIGVNNFCEGVSTCALWTICFPFMWCAPSPREDIEKTLRVMEKKKQFVELAASLGYYEDPNKRKKDDVPWMIYTDRYIRIPDNESNKQ